MPVSPEKKAESLARDFGGQGKLAAVLGVERSTVSRWVRGSAPDSAHVEVSESTKVGLLIVTG